MASLGNGMSLLNASPFYQTIVKGMVLLLAVWFDMSRQNSGRS
jgi:D-xylose transport system permease protein